MRYMYCILLDFDVLGSGSRLIRFRRSFWSDNVVKAEFPNAWLRDRRETVAFTLIRQMLLILKQQCVRHPSHGLRGTS